MAVGARSLSRLEGEFHGRSEASIDESELAAALAPAGFGDVQRRLAIARFLSGDAGWRDAAASLGGAFAGGAQNGTGLTGGKEG